MAAIVASAFGGAPGGTPDQQLIFDIFDGALGAGTPFLKYFDNLAPAAYLNYIFFDEHFEDEPIFGYQPVTEAAAVPIGYPVLAIPEQLKLEFIPEKAGYLYIYVAVEGSDNIDFFF